MRRTKTQRHHRGNLTNQLDLQPTAVRRGVHLYAVNQAADRFQGRSAVTRLVERCLEVGQLLAVNLSEIVT